MSAFSRPPPLSCRGRSRAGRVFGDGPGAEGLAPHEGPPPPLTPRRLVERRALGPLLADIRRGATPWGEDARHVLGLAAPPGGSVAPPADTLGGLPERAAL